MRSLWLFVPRSRVPKLGAFQGFARERAAIEVTAFRDLAVLLYAGFPNRVPEFFDWGFWGDEDVA